MNKTNTIYFDRYAWQSPLTKEQFIPPQDLEMVVVIPAYKEDDLPRAIQSLLDCEPIEGRVIILPLINAPEDANKHTLSINQDSFNQVNQISHPRIEIKPFQVLLPPRKAGVGLARKIGMDEAARWFSSINKNGIIICYDADCRCAPNYLQAIQSYYQSDKQAGVVYYEHDLDETSGIIEYELSLRYLTDGFRYAGFPYAYQTVGSCMTVKSDTYCKVGGMNTRKAGEDFYFINKLIPACNFGETNETTVYPGVRISDRVPFGTGRALGEIKNDGRIIDLYHPQTFEDLRSFLTHVPELARGKTSDMPISVSTFMETINFEINLKKIQNNATPSSFQKQFFGWFDAFVLLKYLHHTRDHYYPNVDIQKGLSALNKMYWQINDFDQQNLKKQLHCIRGKNRSWKQTN